MGELHHRAVLTTHLFLTLSHFHLFKNMLFREFPGSHGYLILHQLGLAHTRTHISFLAAVIQLQFLSHCAVTEPQHKQSVTVQLLNHSTVSHCAISS